MRTQEYWLILDYGRHIINMMATIYYIFLQYIIQIKNITICWFCFSFYFIVYGFTINYLHIARTLGTNKHAYIVNPVV